MKYRSFLEKEIQLLHSIRKYGSQPLRDRFSSSKDTEWDYLKDDYDFMHFAVSMSGYCIEFASKRLQANPEIAIRAVQDYPQCIKWVSTQLTNDKSFIFTLFEYVNPNVLFPYIKTPVRYDPDLIDYVLKQGMSSMILDGGQVVAYGKTPCIPFYSNYNDIVKVPTETLKKNQKVVKSLKYSREDRKKITQLLNWLNAGNNKEQLLI